MVNIPTGIQGLDELLSGGFPEGRVILVLGGPGTGKTILASQFLYKGIYDYNENGIFVSLDESKHHYYSEMGNFGWNFNKAEEEAKFIFIDATRMSRTALLRDQMRGDPSSLRGRQLPIGKLVENIEEKIHQIDAKRIVIDTLATLFHRFPDPFERKTAIVDLVESLSELGITSIITTELSHFGSDRSITDEEYMVHGALIMETLFFQENMTRALHVEKMRGTKVVQKRVPYIIDKNGIEAFPDMRLFQD